MLGMKRSVCIKLVIAYVAKGSLTTSVVGTKAGTSSSHQKAKFGKYQTISSVHTYLYVASESEIPAATPEDL